MPHGNHVVFRSVGEIILIGDSGIISTRGRGILGVVVSKSQKVLSGLIEGDDFIFEVSKPDVASISRCNIYLLLRATVKIYVINNNMSC